MNNYVNIENDIKKYFNFTGELKFHWHRFENLKNLKYDVYQTEQLNLDHKFKDDSYRKLLENAENVWEYSTLNMRYIHGSVFKPYLPELSSSHSSYPKDIDILFYGFLSDRRKTLINELKKKYKIEIHSFLPESELIEKTNRSKWVLSYGTYNNDYNDSIRITRALNLGANILMENCEECWYEDYLKKHFKGRISFL